MSTESAPVPQPEGSENSQNAHQSAIPGDPYKPMPSSEAGVSAAVEQPGASETSDGSSPAEQHVIDGIRSYTPDGPHMTDEVLASTAAEVVEVTGKMDDESLVAAHDDVSRIFGGMQNWEQTLGVEPAAVGKYFEPLVGAYEAGDAEALEDLQGMIGVADQGLWSRALNNLGRDLELEQGEAGPGGDDTGKRVELYGLDEADDQSLTEQLFNPEEDKAFLDRLNEVAEAYSTTSRVMQLLPFADPERAKHVYDMALDAPDPTPEGMAGVSAGLVNLTLVSGEDALPLWRRAIGVMVKDIGENGYDGDTAFIVSSSMHGTLHRLDAKIRNERQDPEADPGQIKADEALRVKLDNLAFEDMPPSFEQRQETAKRMQRLLHETGIEGERRQARWN